MPFQTGFPRENEFILVKLTIPIIFMFQQEPFIFSLRQKTLQGNT